MKNKTLILNAAILLIVFCTFGTWFFSGCDGTGYDDTGIKSQIDQNSDTAIEAQENSEQALERSRYAVDEIIKNRDYIIENLGRISKQRIRIDSLELRIEILEADTGATWIFWHPPEQGNNNPVFEYRIYLDSTLVWSGQDTTISLEREIKLSAWNPAGEVFWVGKLMIK